MTFDEIEKILGADAVEEIQGAVSNACVSAQAVHDRDQALEAMSELMIAMLASIVVVPPDGASERAQACGKRLRDVVRVTLSITPTRGRLSS